MFPVFPLLVLGDVKWRDQWEEQTQATEQTWSHLFKQLSILDVLLPTAVDAMRD